MTKKELKALAKKVAKLEYTIQTSSDKSIVNSAKDEMMKLTESADLELDDMLALDELVQKFMNEWRNENI